MKMRIVLLLLAHASIAEAQNVAANVGALEVVGMPGGEHFGVYPYVGPSLVIPTKHVTLVPGLAVEYSPEFERWGFVATLVADFSVSRRMGLDVTGALVHDQSGLNFDEAAYFGGAGVGFSVFADRWTISPFALVFRGLNVPGYSLVPGLNLGLTL